VFDLANDPYETKNLADDAELRDRLQKEFDEQSKAVAYKMPAEVANAKQQPAQPRRRKRASAQSGKRAQSQMPAALRVGRAGHAFDHLGAIGNQAVAAATSGATIIYATGLGGYGYAGLPPADELAAQREQVTAYNLDAKRRGIELAIGYVCATSIVKLDSFDKNWPADLRAKLKTAPSEWRQQDKNGQPLASWYGGDYAPACMNNPDWRAYEEFIVRQQ
jgi:hypothetical protein